MVVHGCGVGWCGRERIRYCGARLWSGLVRKRENKILGLGVQFTWCTTVEWVGAEERE